jgi:hypothetical protein
VSAVSQNKQLEIINIPRRDILGVAYSDFLQSYFGVVCLELQQRTWEKPRE